MPDDDEYARAEQARQEALVQKGHDDYIAACQKSHEDYAAQQQYHQAQYEVQQRARAQWDEASAAREKSHKDYHDRLRREAQEKSDWKKYYEPREGPANRNDVARDRSAQRNGLSHELKFSPSRNSESRRSGSGGGKKSETSDEILSEVLKGGAIILATLLLMPIARDIFHRLHSTFTNPIQRNRSAGIACPVISQNVDFSGFERNLTVGDRGADVCVLQQHLIEAGFLNIPAPTGYFGEQTRQAVATWQNSIGLPPTGFFGPRSRDEINGDSEEAGN